MNVDLLVGLVIGLSGSVLTLVGTLISNKQKHKHEAEMTEKKDAQELKLSMQRLVFENSFKDYEHGANLAVKIAETTGQGLKIYPYDMYLVTYSKIIKYLSKEDATPEDLTDLLQDMEYVKQDYDAYQRRL